MVCCNSLSEEGADDERGQSRADEGEVRVDDRPMEGVSLSQERVEGRPEHPQEDGPQHSKEVRGVAGGLQMFRGAQLTSAGDVGHGQTEVRAEDVNENGTTLEYTRTLTRLQPDIIF